jgi:hypothetical protein
MVASTVASDALLALTCAGAALWSLRQSGPVHRYAAVGFGLMALGAALGSVRFAGVDALVPAHRGAARLAGAVAPGCFALVALALARDWSRRFVEYGLLALGLAWVVFDLVLDLGVLYRTVIGVVAVGVMIGVGVRARGRPGGALVLGALTLALAGLAIGTEGTIGPVLAVDVFHVALATAHLSLAAGLVGLRRRDGSA